MKRILWITVLLATLGSFSGPLAWVGAALAAVPAELAELDGNASEAQNTAALEAAAEWMNSDFEAARPSILAKIRQDSLPAEFRARLLRAFISSAKAASRLDIESEVGPAYRTLAELLPAGLERSRLHRAYGNLNIWRGQFEAAESLFRRALEDYDSEDITERAEVNNSLGVALAQQGKLDDALSTMIEAYRLFEQTEAGPSINLLRNIGGLSIYLEDWERSVTFSRLAIERSDPDDPSISGVYSNLAAALTEQGKFEPALEALERGMAIDEANGQPNSSVISNMGYVLRELGRTEEALDHFRRAVEIDRRTDDTATLAISLKNVGETLIHLGRREEADAVLQESLATYRKADIKPKRLELYPVLVENLEALERFPQALAMMREYRELTEELASAEAQARVAELQTAFDLERKERELAESERERLAGEARLAAVEAEQSRQRLFSGLLAAGLVALGVFLILMLRLLRVRTRANRLLAEKNAEIDQQHKALGETNARLERQSIEDELTGLGNRRSVRRLLQSEIPPALGQAPALLMLIDLDRFKGINDRFGHHVGDEVLSAFAQALRDVAGPDDVLARWGGEEFLWLVPDCDFPGARDRCRALIERVGNSDLHADGRKLSITASIGVTQIDLDADDLPREFELALKIADEALYEAKNAGRNGAAGFERLAADPAAFEGSLDIDALIERGALIRKKL